MNRNRPNKAQVRKAMKAVRKFVKKYDKHTELYAAIAPKEIRK